MRCKCPSSFRYHAINCPDTPSVVRNRLFHERCLEEERRLAEFKQWIVRPGNLRVAARRLAKAMGA